jgi:hypothetical protein
MTYFIYSQILAAKTYDKFSETIFYFVHFWQMYTLIDILMILHPRSVIYYFFFGTLPLNMNYMYFLDISELQFTKNLVLPYVVDRNLLSCK